ncbi:uncharacterized protein LOC132043402 [Lycium ferocissimum]|uniref:uncharacterized protein LOC132043402 n=1 Tax=Lycium ferocissimum TaxID=112874 RepID=UPI0028169ED4|nr:uncharacterized protein LOC132043402 [Lycium ferocissimum]
MSTPAYYPKVKERYFYMRPLIWDPWFMPERETSIAVAWISFLELPPNFFARKAVFSMTSTIGKPLSVDLATTNRTRPSCVKVKVQLDLLSKHRTRINVAEVNEETGQSKSKWIKLNYDYLPKYCKHCKLQGHGEEECRSLHPELQRQFREETKKNETIEVEAQQKKENNRGGWNYKGKKEWMKSRHNKYVRDKSRIIIAEIGKENNKKEDKTVETKNAFDVLTKEDEEQEVVEVEQRISTKEWIKNNFPKSTSPKQQKQKENKGDSESGEGVQNKGGESIVDGHEIETIIEKNEENKDPRDVLQSEEGETIVAT